MTRFMKTLFIAVLASVAVTAALSGCGKDSNNQAQYVPQYPVAGVYPGSTAFGPGGFIRYYGYLSNLDGSTANSMVNNLRQPWGWSFSFNFGYSPSTVEIDLMGGTAQVILTVKGTPIRGNATI